MTTDMIPGPNKMKLTCEEMRGKNHQIQRRCIMDRPDGSKVAVSPAHISRIFNPAHSNTPGPGLARKIAAAITEILGRTITMDDVYEYLEVELGKSLDWPKSERDSAWSWMVVVLVLLVAMLRLKLIPRPRG